MYNTNIADAKDNLHTLVSVALNNDEVINITTNDGNAVMLSETGYKSLVETLYLYSIPGMVDSITTAAASPVEDWIDGSEVGW